MFQFEAPSWLILLPIAVLLWLGWNWFARRRQKRTLDWLDQRLLPNAGKRSATWKALLASICFVLAAANPQFSNQKRPVEQEGLDIVVALDISASMYANDILPNRMERAKQLVQQLVRALSNNRIGFIVFAGGAYLQSPLTTDYQIFDVLLPAVSPSQAGQQGTSFASVLDLSNSIFEEEKENGRALIIISDGENHDEAALVKADALGINVFTVGVGTTQGGKIPLTNGQNKRTANGQEIISRLNRDYLIELAQEGRGQYYDLESLSGNPKQLVNTLDRLQKRTIAVRSYTDFGSYFQWLLGAGIFFTFWQLIGRWDAFAKALFKRN